MRNGSLKTDVGSSGPAAGGGPFFSPHQETLKELYKLEPDACLKSIACKLREILNCETVCILLWNEGLQQLITRYESGMPKGLFQPEAYGPQEGITGKIIFSENRWVNCQIDMAARRIYDKYTRRLIDEGTTKWHNMEVYEEHTAHGFKSLLGAPFSVRSQKLGAVKLINKLDAQGQLDEEGFDTQDIETLSYFLDAIEHVVGIKSNEKQVHSLLRIGQKLVSSHSDYEETLREIAANCADALNYRVCLIRLFEGSRLKIRAGNITVPDDDPDVKRSPTLKAIEHKIPLKCVNYEGKGKSPHIQIDSAEGHKLIKIPNVDANFFRFLDNLSLKSFLIVPIIQRGGVIGTIECYSSLPREFSSHELDIIRIYVDALIISTLNNRQQSLLTNLIDLQRIGTVSDGEGEQEEKVIDGLLSRTKVLLGRRLKTLSVIFSEERLAKSKINCKQFYGASKNELKAALGEKQFEKVLAELNGPGGSDPKGTPGRDAARRGRARGNSRRKELNVIKVGVFTEGEDAPIGLLLLCLQTSESKDEFAAQVAELTANLLGVTLTNIEEIRLWKGLPKIIRDASHAAAENEIYDFILKQTIEFFGFDFGAISRVDHMSRVIETVKTKTAKRNLVDPEQWRRLSRYPLDSGDILSWVCRRKTHVIIDALGADQARDQRLDENIYTTFRHRDLARIWVPFIFSKAGSGGKQDDFVIGVIEAGYHRKTQEHISKQKSELFVLFVDSCANSLQRIMLLEERKSVDDILERFNQVKQSESQKRKPKIILEKLLEESVKLVQGDWGAITFLTHYNDRITFLDEISYNLPPIKPERLLRELEVAPEGKTGITGHVAWEGKPYWSNDVSTDPFYQKEVEGVQSELAVPLRVEGRVIGVLDINSNKKEWFDERKARLVETVADQGTALYHNARVVEPLYKLKSPFNPFASPREVYARVVDIIEDFLHTKTVSVWEKQVVNSQPGDNQFKLNLVAASDELRERYVAAGITELPPDCFTGKTVTTGKSVEVDLQQIRTEFITRDFAEANQLRSMTAVPISVGNEVYGAIDVFSRRDTKLFGEELAILEILAGKAAIALQSATLIQSFNKVASIAPGDDIKSVLESITKSALVRLHAEPVILFRYDAETDQLDPEAIVAGDFYYPEVRMVTTKNEMAKMILKLKESRYLKNEVDYLEFEAEVNRNWHSNRFPTDFWHREKIKSLAALKLEHGGELVGMMFINFREQKDFPEHDKRLMEVFAAQAASVIYNAKTWERNNRYWEMQRADSLSLSVSEIVSSLAHNSGNLLYSINQRYGRLQQFLTKSAGSAVPKSKVKELADRLEEPLDELVQDFNRLKDYRRFDKLNIQPCDVNELIHQSLHMLRVKFDNRRITVDTKKLANDLPLVLCDRNQIGHVLLNLFLNAVDAMGNKGKLSVATKALTDRTPAGVQIRISDTGSGIEPENKNKIFRPNFTTKVMKEGSGLGLPISKYIVEKHGGEIDLASTVGKGTTFFIHLPLEGQGEHHA